MRLAEKDRKLFSDATYSRTGVQWRWVPGSNIPDPNKVETYNSEAVTVPLTSSLFADDTSIVGETREIDDGTRITKEVMSQFEEKNNDDKEVRGVFGTDNANALQTLDIWERQQAHHHQLTDTVEDRDFVPPTPSFEYSDCGKVCKSQRGFKTAL